MKPANRYNRNMPAIIMDDDDESSTIQSTAKLVHDKAKKTPSRRTMKERRLREAKIFNSGRWSLLEKKQFLIGLQKFGAGEWKKIGTILTTRSNVQIKSHSQKVLKQMDNGKNIFALLDEEHSGATLGNEDTTSCVSFSDSDEDHEQAASMIDSDDNGDYWDGLQLQAEESIVVQALVELADPIMLSKRVAKAAATSGGTVFAL